LKKLNKDYSRWSSYSFNCGFEEFSRRGFGYTTEQIVRAVFLFANMKV
jgi:hypothetical protein